MPKKPMKTQAGLKDGAAVSQHKAAAMGIKPAQGKAQPRPGMSGKAGGKPSNY